MPAQLGRLIAVTVAVFLVGACQPATTPQQFVTETPRAAPLPGDTHAIAFAKVASSIARDTQVGKYEPGFSSFGCVSYVDPHLFWDRAMLSDNEAEFSDKAFRILSDSGFDAVGDPQQLFGGHEDAARSTFQLGAVVTELDLDLCAAKEVWTGQPNGLVAGKGRATFRWELYSIHGRRVVFKKATTGTATIPRPGVEEGKHVLFVEAFGDALRALTADPGFRAAVAKDSPSPHAPSIAGEPIRLAGAPPFAGPADERRWDRLTDAAVTIGTAAAHGSGAVIDADGWVLTNAHVVGEAEAVTVGFRNGIRVQGHVVRRHSGRDVALVRVPISGVKPLPARRDAARVGEPVYAIGTPLDEKLRATLTAGVVSAWRTDEATGARFIQADVGIHAGSSGGPLLDAAGNLLGIAVAGYTLGDAGVGINWFVPIGEALDALAIQMAPAP